MKTEPCDKCGGNTIRVECALEHRDVLRCIKCHHEQEIEPECDGKSCGGF